MKRIIFLAALFVTALATGQINASRVDGLIFGKEYTTAYLEGLSSPPEFLLVRDSDKNALVYYDGTAWVELGGGTYTFSTGLTNTSGTITVTNPFEEADETKLDGIETGATADQIAAEVPITDTGNYFTGTDVEAALQEIGSGAAGGSGIVAEGTFNTSSGTGVYTVTHGLGYIPSVTRIQIQEYNNPVCCANQPTAIENITSTTFDVLTTTSTEFNYAWRIFGNGLFEGEVDTDDQTAAEVTVSATPVNYTPDDTSVEGHLGGLDDALAIVSSGLTPADIGASDKTLTASDFGKFNYTDDSIQLTVDNSVPVGSRAAFVNSNIDSVITFVPDTGVTIFGNGYDVISGNHKIDSTNVSNLVKLADNLFYVSGYVKTFSSFTAYPNESNGNTEMVTGDALAFGSNSSTTLATSILSNSTTSAVVADGQTYNTTHARRVTATTTGTLRRMVFDFTVTNATSYHIDILKRVAVGTTGRYRIALGSADTNDTTFTDTTFELDSFDVTTNSTSLRLELYVANGTANAGDACDYVVSIKQN